MGAPEQNWSNVSLHAFFLFAFIHSSQSIRKYRGRKSTAALNNNSNLLAPKLVRRTIATLIEKPNHCSMKRELAIWYLKQ